jgi:hypothetical protein
MSPTDYQEPTTVDREPVAVYQAVALVVVAAGAFGIVLDPSTIATAIAAVIGIVSMVVAAVKARIKVTPVEFPKYD